MNVEENMFPPEVEKPTLGGKSYPEEDVEAIVERFFVDTVDGVEVNKVPQRGRAHAGVKILLGAPGSGKSYNAAKDYFALDQVARSSTIYVSYDETGAIYAIPGFKEELAAAIGCEVDDLKEHGQIDVLPEQYDDVEAVWTKYRPLSQHIRARILNRAAADGFDMVIDTTSSSPGTLKMIEALQNAGYSKENIGIEGTYAPMEISQYRVEHRPRKASHLELITKRIGDPEEHKGAINMIEPLVEAAGSVVYRFNPDNEHAPQEAFVFENGQLVGHDPQVVAAMQRCLGHDNLYTRELLMVVRAQSEDNLKALEGYGEFCDETYRELDRFLVERVLRAGPALDNVPSPGQ